MPLAGGEQRALPWACREEEGEKSTKNFITREIVSYGLAWLRLCWLFPGQAARSQGPGSHLAMPRTSPVGYDLFFCNTLKVWVIMLGFGVFSSMKTASI